MLYIWNSSVIIYWLSNGSDVHKASSESAHSRIWVVFLWENGYRVRSRNIRSRILLFMSGVGFECLLTQVSNLTLL